MELELPALLSALAPLIAMISAFATPLIHLVSRSRRTVFAFSELVLLVNAVITIYVAYYVYSTGKVLYYIFAGFPPPLGEAYEVDHISAFMGLLVGAIFPVVNVFSYTYLARFSGIEWYYTLYLGLESGLLGIAYTGDVFNLFVMLEVASIASYALVAFKRHLGYPIDAAIKYALVGSVASTIYFIAAVLAYSSFGTLSMADIAAQLGGLRTLFDVTYGTVSNVSLAASIVLGLAVWAFLIEAALVPHHFWLPDAYSSAPATVAATLAAVAEGLAVYVVLRFTYTIVGIRNSIWLLWILLILGSVAVIFGGIMLTLQNELKRLIAYSTVMDVGFMFLGVGIGTKTALLATLYYVLSHSIVKPLLFLTAGAIDKIYGTTVLDALKGRLRSSPILALGLVIGGLAVAGVPPTNLFMAKLSLFVAVLNASYYPLIAVIVIGSALGLVGFMRAFYATYFETSEREVRVERLKSLEVIVLALVIATLATGILYTLISNMFVEPAVNSLVNIKAKITYIKVAEEYFKLAGLR